MLQKLFKAGLIIFSLLIGAFASVATLLWVYEDEFGSKILMQLREQSNAEITLEGQSFSFWRSLPYVSYDLKKIEIKGGNSKSILKAEVLGLRLSLRSVFRKKLKLKNVLVQDGTINVVINKSGKANYDIFSTGVEKESEDSYFKSTELDYTKLKRVHLNYTDHKNGWSSRVLFKDALLNYIQDNIESNLDLEGKGVVLAFRKQKDKLLTNLPFDLNVLVTNNVEKDLWTFKTNKLLLSKDEYTLQGIYNGQYPNPIDIRLKTSRGHIQNVLSVFPLAINSQQNLNIRGIYDLNLSFSGESAKQNGVALNIISNVREAFLENDKMPDPIEDIYAEINITKPKNKNWEHLNMRISELNLTSTSLHFNSNINIKGLKSPIIEFGGEGTLSLPAIIGLFSLNGLSSNRGSVSTKGLTGKASYKNDSWQVDELQGKLLVEHGMLDINKQLIGLPKVVLSMNKNQLNIENSELQFNQRPLTFSASIPNVSRNLRSNKLIINTNLKLKNLDYQEIDKLFRSENHSKKTKGKKDSISANRIDYVINLSSFIENFTYQKREFKNLSLNMDIDKNHIDFSILTEAYQGALTANGTYLLEKKPRLRLNLETKEVQISELLRNFDNFDQDVIMDKNIKGGMNSKNVIKLFWDEEGNYLNDELQVYSDIGIFNGELNGVTMLYNFSNYIKLRDLMEIKFTQLHNYLEISNREIYIPQMFIQSNALNLTLAGKHSFDNNINYSFKLNAGQLLLNKLKKYTGNKKALPAKRDGMFNMYFNLHGTIDDYEVLNSRKNVTEYFKESSTHKYIIYEELKRAYPDITNHLYEPEEWLDFGSTNISEKQVNIPKIEDKKQSNRGEEEYIDGF